MRNFKIALYTALAVVVVVCLFVGVDLAFAVAMTTTGHFLGLPWMAEISVLWLIIAFWILPKDWLAINRIYRCHGSAMIDAPIAQVWDAVVLRPRGATYRPVVTKITADLVEPDRYVYHFDTRVSADAAGQGARVVVDVTDAQPNAYLRTEYPHTSSLPSWSRDILCSEVTLEQTDAGVKVTFVETLRRLTVPTIFSLMFLNPCKDTAQRLKSWVEGTDDPSWMGRFMAGVGADGTPPEELRSGVVVASVTAVVVLSAVVFGVVSFIIFALPDS
jgi:hypothetical protein